MLLKITCQCPTGYYGSSCQYITNVNKIFTKFFKNLTENFIILKPCVPNPCSTNGACQVSQTNPTLFTCQCNPGYYGTYCESMINSCSSNPCRNGTCVSSLLMYSCKYV